METRIETFKNLLLNSEQHLNKCQAFSEFERNYIDKNYDNFLIELKYKLVAKTSSGTFQLMVEIGRPAGIDSTLFTITKNLLETSGLIERFKYKECFEGLINEYEIFTDFDYVMKFNSEKNKFELNNRYCPYFGIKSLIGNENLGRNSLKGLLGQSKIKETFGLLRSKSEFPEILKSIKPLKEVFETSKKLIKKDLKELFAIILDKKIKKYNELTKIKELNLNRDVDNKILSFESKQDLCKPLIENWINKNIKSDIRKYFYPNFIVSLYDDKWILFDFDADEYFVE